MFPRTFMAGLVAAMVVAGCAGPAPAPEPGKPGGGQQTPPAAQPLTEAEARQAVVKEIEAKGPTASNPYRFQYGVTAGTQVAGDWQFRVVEFQRYTGQPWSLVEQSTYRASRQDVKVQVSVAAGTTRGQVTGTGDEMTLERDGTKISVFQLANLPNTFRPYGAPADTEFGVGKAGWGALALSPDLNIIAFVTRGTHAFFGVIKADTKALKGLDLIYGGGPGELAWSLDGKLLATTVAAASGAFPLQLWDPAVAQKLPVTGLPELPEVRNLNWQGNTLHFQIGHEKWTLDPATGVAKKG